MCTQNRMELDVNKQLKILKLIISFFQLQFFVNLCSHFFLPTYIQQSSLSFRLIIKPNSICLCLNWWLYIVMLFLIHAFIFRNYVFSANGKNVSSQFLFHLAELHIHTYIHGGNRDNIQPVSKMTTRARYSKYPSRAVSSFIHIFKITKVKVMII
jgi:hypothetical protein